MDINDDPCTCLMPGRDYNCPACLRAAEFVQALEERDPPGRRWYNHAEGDICSVIDIAAIVHAAKGTPRCPDCNSRPHLYVTELPRDHEDYEFLSRREGDPLQGPYDWMIGLAHDASCPQIAALKAT